MMKKLIVLGILAAMLMGLAVVAQATPATPAWVVSVMATTDAASVDGQAYGSFGLYSKSSDTYANITAGVNPALPEINYTSSTASVTSYTAANREYVAKMSTADAGAPSSTVTTDWFFQAQNCTNNAGGTMYVTAWNLSTAQYVIPSGLPYTVTMYELTGAGGTIIPSSAYTFQTGTGANKGTGTWASGTGVGGTYNQWVLTNVPTNGFVNFELVAAPQITPEPGSLALFSGLVGLVGYGIRRRK